MSSLTFLLLSRHSVQDPRQEKQKGRAAGKPDIIHPSHSAEKKCARCLAEAADADRLGALITGVALGLLLFVLATITTWYKTAEHLLASHLPRVNKLICSCEM